MPVGIKWYGLLSNGSTDSYVRSSRRLLETFLEEANLQYGGRDAVGFDPDPLCTLSAGKIGLIDAPEHWSHVDLLLRAERYSDALKVRVSWNCRGLFPVDKGVPTPERIRKAINEFNELGVVSTKLDDMPMMGSSFSSFVPRERPRHRGR